MRRVYKSNNDYDSVDLTSIPQDYLQRCMYTMGCDFTTYCSGIPTTVDKKTYTAFYRLFMRKMLNQNGERTLIGAIMPSKVGHTNGILGFAFENEKDLLTVAASFASLPYDFSSKLWENQISIQKLLAKCPIWLQTMLAY